MEPVWDKVSREHIAKHRVQAHEVEFVLSGLQPPFPQDIGNGKYLVQGQTDEGRFLQVIYVYRPVQTLDWTAMEWEDRLALADVEENEVVYVVHARDLTEREKRALRRRIQ